MKLCLTFIAIMLTACQANQEPAPPDAPRGDVAFVSLFDGRTLDGWDGDPWLWSIEEGAITGRTTAENNADANTFLIWRGGQVADFELRLKVRLRGINSGIQYRSKNVGNWVVHGYQCDLGTGGARHYGKLSEEKGRRWLAQAGQKVVIDKDGKTNVVGKVGDAAAIEKGMPEWEWADVTITARGERLIHTVNGEVTVDVVDRDEKHAARSGVLAFQIHHGEPMEVQFKNVQLRKLPPQ